jgi:hypothetical protein
MSWIGLANVKGAAAVNSAAGICSLLRDTHPTSPLLLLLLLASFAVLLSAVAAAAAAAASDPERLSVSGLR